MSTPQRYGIIIGVRDYSKVAPGGDLRFTVNDAQRVYSTLLKHAEFKSENLRLFCDLSEKDANHGAHAPLRSDILSTVKAFAAKTGPEDLLLIYFAGHGVEIAEKPYLLTNDTRMDVVKETAIDVALLNQYLKESKAKCVLRFFDACRVPTGNTRSLPVEMTRGLEAAFLKAAHGWGTLNSCSSGEYSFEHEDLQHGVFTYFLCEGLAGKAADDNGVVRWDTLVDYVKTSIAAYVQSQSWKQTPHAISDFAGSLELVRSQKTTEPPATHQPTSDDASALLAGVFERHLAALPVHVRDFAVTSEGEFLVFNNTIVDCLKAWRDKVITDALRIDVTAKGPLQNHDVAAWQLLNKSIGELKLSAEFSNQTQTVEVTITPTQLVLPSTKVLLVTARLQFLYLLWFRHECLRTSAHTTWNPEPLITSGHFSFKPGGVRKRDKVSEVTAAIFRRLATDIDEWAEQSKQHFVTRVAPLNDISQIIG